MYVERVKNFTSKSFKNYTGPNDNAKFNAHNNIAFGYNGRGKSTLAQKIKEDYIKINSGVNNINETIRYFDSNYVSENLMLTQGDSKTIKGVIANFGTKNVNIEKQIQDKTDELAKIKSNLSAKEKDRDNKGQKIFNIIKSIHDNRKGKGNKIQNVANENCIITGFSSCITTYQSNYDKVVKFNKIATDEEVHTFSSDIDFDQRIDDVTKVPIPAISSLSPSEIDEIHNLCEKQFIDKSLPPDVLDWIAKGIKIHEGESRCIFCGGEIASLDKIKEDYDRHNKEQTTIASNSLVSYRNRIDAVIATLDNINNNELLYSQNFIGVEKQWFEKLAGDIATLKGIFSLIQNKISDMSKAVTINVKELEECLNSAIDLYNKLRKARSDTISNLTVQSSKKNDMLKAAIASDVFETPGLQDSIIEHQKIINEINNLNVELSKKQQEISVLQTSKSDIADFADDLNEILRNINIDIKLEASNKNYYLKHAKEDIQLSLKDISEGEKNLLALLYFYCELFEDKEKKKFKDSIGLLIIDDPISSLDDNNKIFILGLIDDVCHKSKVGTQVFIFTHVWDNFADLFRRCNKIKRKETGTNGDIDSVADYSFWEIKKDKNGNSYIESTNKKNIITPYRYAFKKLYDSYLICKEKGVDELGDDVYGLPNLMRCVLERYCEFKFGTFGSYSPSPERLAELLCGSSNDPNNVRGADQLLKVCNAFSHRTDHSPDEIYTAIDFFFRNIEKTDKVHFDSMKA